MLKLMKFLIVGLFVLLGFLILGVFVLSRFAYDDPHAYNASAAALPLFGVDGQGDGLVQIEADGWTYRARIAGFKTSAPIGDIVLLHGFPESSIMWESLTQVAATQGFRVVAFDQRGYSPGARPDGADNYTGAQLVADVMAVAQAVGFEDFHLVGHDWGALVGWQTAFKHPQKITSFTALSVPHFAAIGESFEQQPELAARSNYITIFQLPWLAEAVLGMRERAQLRNLYAEHPDHHVNEYMALFGARGALTSALNWYRGGLDTMIGHPEKLHVPTQFIWGEYDDTINSLAVELQRGYVAEPFEIVTLDGGHWIAVTHAKQVNQHVMRHINNNLQRSGWAKNLDTKVYFESYGNGEPMILVHGWGGDCRSNWYATGWVQRLTEHRRLICLDVRGHGRSDKSHDAEDYSYTAMATDVIAVMDHLSIDQADYLGYSMGSFMGAALLSRHPERFRSMVLGGIGNETFESAQAGALVAQALRADRFEDITSEYGKAVWQYVQSTGQNDLEALAISAQQMWPEGYPLKVAGDGINRAQFPVLVINGGDDLPYVDTAQDFVDALTNGQYVSIPGLNHITAMTDQRFMDAVISFVNAIPD
ncbi:MAG: alpha/beta hydrolase [Pseudomonadota bacterium]